MYIDENGTDSNARNSSFLYQKTGTVKKKPTNITSCYFLLGSYVTSIGSCGSITGTRSNLAMANYYEFQYPGQSINFFEWIIINLPATLINTILTWAYLQWYFMGMFRPNSFEAKKYYLGKSGEQIVKGVIKRQLKELGPISQQEIQIAILFMALILLYVFTIPGKLLAFPFYTLKRSKNVVIILRIQDHLDELCRRKRH